jgi:hypothetical protein
MANNIDYKDTVLVRRSGEEIDKVKNHHRSSRKNQPSHEKLIEESHHRYQQKNEKQLQHGLQRSLAQAAFDLNTLSQLKHTPLPAGLKFPKELSLEQLQGIINEFHAQETRTDLLSNLPLDFEPQKSVFSFLYTLNTFKDPTTVNIDTISLMFANFCMPTYFATPNFHLYANSRISQDVL